MHSETGIQTGRRNLWSEQYIHNQLSGAEDIVWHPWGSDGPSLVPRTLKHKSDIKKKVSHHSEGACYELH